MRPLRPRHAFGKLYLGDLANGISSSLPRLIASTVLFALLCLTLYFDAHSSMRITGQVTLGFGDYLASVYNGGREHLDDLSLFRTPTAWLSVCALAAYVVLDYPLHDLKGAGMYMIIASGSRWRWWFSKCLWIVTCTFVFWILSLAVCALWTGATGGPFDFELRSSTVLALQMYRDVASSSSYELLYPILLIPFALSALLLIQLAISLLVRPILGFVSTMVILYGSAFFLSPWLIGNYLMVARTDVVRTAGVSVPMGILLSLSLILAAVLVGGFLFSRFNIINRGDDDA